MSLQPQAIPAVPTTTASTAHAAFPHGNRYLSMRDELGTFYNDLDFVALFPTRGQPAHTPWRLALVLVMQFAEGLSDTQAADAVCGRIDWKYALSLELDDAGFDASILSEFRTRLVTGNAERQLLDVMLSLALNSCKIQLCVGFPVPESYFRVLCRHKRPKYVGTTWVYSWLHTRKFGGKVEEPRTDGGEVEKCVRHQVSNHSPIRESLWAQPFLTVNRRNAVPVATPAESCYHQLFNASLTLQRNRPAQGARPSTDRLDACAGRGTSPQPTILYRGDIPARS